MNITSRPVAVVFEKNCRRNIRNMAEKAASQKAAFRPHFKTHQSIEIGRWFRDEGVSGITVSTPEMAAYFAKDGWDDITIAFPFFPAQLPAIKKLQKSCSLRLFVNQPQIIHLLSENLENPVDILIEIDAGYNRSGVKLSHKNLIQSIISAANNSRLTNFYGFYSHNGDTYKVKGKQAVSRVIKRNLDAFTELKTLYPDAVCCLGDTPSCSLIPDLSPADELSPGNFIFYDLMQIEIGSCDFQDIGMLVEVPLAQKKPETDEYIIHGGAVHFSKDRLNNDKQTTFGQPVTVEEDHIKEIIGTSLTELSQEHGTIKGLEAFERHHSDGDRAWICPVHSCLTANLFDHYQTPDGKKISKRILS